MKESESYQQLLKKTEKLISEVSDPEIDLDIMLNKVSEGAELIKKMKDRLDQGKKKLDELLVEFDSTKEKSPEA